MVASRWKRASQVASGLDYMLIISVVLLLIAGIILIYSATNRHHGDTYVKRQVTWAILGLVIAAVVVAIPDYTFRQSAEVFFLLSMVLVLLVYFFGTKAFGARRWLPLLGVRIQPSEFLKVATIIMLAKYADYFKERINSPVALLTLGGFSISAFLLILKQPDLGTAMTIMAITAGIVFIAGINLVLFTCLFCLGAVPLLAPLFYLALGWDISFESSLYVSISCALLMLVFAVISRVADLQIPIGAPILVTIALIGGLMAAPLVFNKLNPYQRRRLTSFLQPEADPRGAGYNLIQSRIAIGSGGLAGKGVFKGSQNVLGFLPHKHTDFIFSVLGEECGFMGIASLISCIGLLLFRAIVIAFQAKDNFGKFVAIGVACMFAFHFLVNIGMTIGLMPITGLPLLLVSYGGSSLITAMFCIGLLLNISLRRERFTF